MNPHERIRVQLSHAAEKVHTAILDVEDGPEEVLHEEDRIRLRAVLRRILALHQVTTNRLQGDEPQRVKDLDTSDLQALESEGLEP